MVYSHLSIILASTGNAIQYVLLRMFKDVKKMTWYSYATLVRIWIGL